MSRDRTDIYYWKCDREAAFHGTSDYLRDQGALKAQLEAALVARFGKDRIRDIAVGAGQGNHRTFTATLDGARVFIRTEDGIEGDNYLAVEALVTERVAAKGVPVVRTIAYDCSRREVPFAWQILPFADFPDLNSHFKAGTLDWTDIAPAIGAGVAQWQDAVAATGFGPFSAERALAEGTLAALHPTSESYYRLNLERHLAFLKAGEFLDERSVGRIRSVVDNAIGCLDEPGVLVHKDLALWNILGTESELRWFIDWDDTVMGDAMDDLSLMACFHGADVLNAIIAGYAAVKPLPPNFAARFWLDLLRNILFKAVIRVGAGYFRRDGKFFLVSGGAESLEQTTRRKIETALAGLEKGWGIDELGK